MLKHRDLHMLKHRDLHMLKHRFEHHTPCIVRTCLWSFRARDCVATLNSMPPPGPPSL